jgi:hypothetical protein
MLLVGYKPDGGNIPAAAKEGFRGSGKLAAVVRGGSML